MVRLFALLVFVFSLLEANSHQELLKRADALLQSQNKSDTFRAYNDYKNIYLQALINEDDPLRIQALRGVVKSGKRLHIDVLKYEQELNQAKSIKPKQKQSQEILKETSATNYITLQSASVDGDKITFHFSHKLLPKNVNYFKLEESEKKSFRYIFDVDAQLSSSFATIQREGIKYIKIAQFKKNITRIVFENDSKLRVRHFLNKKQLVVSLSDMTPKTPHAKITPHAKLEPHAKIEPHAKTVSTKKFVNPKNKIVVLDAGHGGKDPGAVGYRGYREKIIVFDISRMLQEILTKRGYRVYMTRNRDNFLKLSTRTKLANDKKADLFISIHANAVGGKAGAKVQGIECYFLSTSKSEKATRVAELENSADLSEMNSYGKQSFLNFLNSHKIVASNKLAIDLQSGMLSRVRKLHQDVVDGGVREGPFWVLVGAQMPAVLVEVGFVTNPTEAKRLVDKKYQELIALGLADGVERYFQNNQ